MDKNLDSISSSEKYRELHLAGRQWWKEMLLVLILIAPNFTFGNEYLLLLLPVLLIVLDYQLWKGGLKNPKQLLKSKESLRYLGLSLLFVGAAAINKFVNGGSIVCLKDYYAAFYLIPFLLFSSRCLFTVRTFRLFIYFVLIETGFALVQYLLNDRSLILPLTEETRIVSKDLLYDSRVFGFTVNSSVYALHIFIAFLFIIPARFNRLFYWLIFSGLALGMLLSFGRTVVLITVVYFIFALLQLCWIYRKQLRSAIRLRHFQNTALSALFLLILFLTPWMRDNMTRGGKSEQMEYNNILFSWDTIPLTCSEQHAYPLKEPSELDTTSGLSKNFLSLTKSINTSGRKLIWLNYVDFLSEHPLTGNGSNKLMFRTLNPKTRAVELIHAHNSFFVFFATHGFVLATVYLIILIVWWRRRNFAVLVALLGYSFLQYGIFWGFSLIDLVFMAMLISPINFIDFGYKRQNS